MQRQIAACKSIKVISKLVLETKLGKFTHLHWLLHDHYIVYKLKGSNAQQYGS